MKHPCEEGDEPRNVVVSLYLFSFFLLPFLLFRWLAKTALRWKKWLGLWSPPPSPPPPPPYHLHQKRTRGSAKRVQKQEMWLGLYSPPPSRGPAHGSAGRNAVDCVNDSKAERNQSRNQA